MVVGFGSAICRKSGLQASSLCRVWRARSPNLLETKSRTVSAVSVRSDVHLAWFRILELEPFLMDFCEKSENSVRRPEKQRSERVWAAINAFRRD
jgi:hypothetical protein